MEFWGVEIKPGKNVKCAPREGSYLHISQASLGESKGKANENVPIFVNIDGKKLVLGTLSLEKCSQIQYDLVFEKEFELSHTSKSTSVYFCGYHAALTNSDDGFPESDSELEDVPARQNANGKSVADAIKVDNSAAKKAKKAELVKADKAKAGDEDDEDDSGDDSDSDKEMSAMMTDSDEESSEEEDESSEEDDETTPEKKAAGKRPAESALKTPVPEKKAKVVTPPGQKTGGDGKKGVVHVATPYPTKKQVAGKTPAANNEKSKQQTPKSAGSVTCNSCERNFKSESALQAHTKAKHG